MYSITANGKLPPHAVRVVPSVRTEDMVMPFKYSTTVSSFSTAAVVVVDMDPDHKCSQNEGQNGGNKS